MIGFSNFEQNNISLAALSFETKWIAEGRMPYQADYYQELLR